MTAHDGELPALARAVSEGLDDLARSSREGTRDVSLFGVGLDEITRGLAALEPRTSRTVWSVQPFLTFDPLDPGIQLNKSSTARGLDLRLVTTPQTLASNPLLPAFYPQLRVAVVPLRMLLLDGVAAVVEGPRSQAGDPTAWFVAGGPLLLALRRYWERAWQVAECLPVHGTCLTGRQSEVARLMCIGGELGVSRRTVERDVSVVMRFVGARGRSEAIALAMGLGRSVVPGVPGPRRSFSRQVSA